MVPDKINILYKGDDSKYNKKIVDRIIIKDATCNFPDKAIRLQSAMYSNPVAVKSVGDKIILDIPY